MAKLDSFQRKLNKISIMEQMANKPKIFRQGFLMLLTPLTLSFLLLENNILSNIFAVVAFIIVITQGIRIIPALTDQRYDDFIITLLITIIAFLPIPSLFGITIFNGLTFHTSLGRIAASSAFIFGGASYIIDSKRKPQTIKWFN